MLRKYLYHLTFTFLTLVVAEDMRRLHLGSKIPLTPSHLTTLDGTKVALCDTEQTTVVCFLRHLG